MNRKEYKPIAFTMDAETKGQLEQLAQEHENTMSGFLRWLIRREYRFHLTERGRAALEETKKGEG